MLADLLRVIHPCDTRVRFCQRRCCKQRQTYTHTHSHTNTHSTPEPTANDAMCMSIFTCAHSSHAHAVCIHISICEHAYACTLYAQPHDIWCVHVSHHKHARTNTMMWRLCLLAPPRIACAIGRRHSDTVECPQVKIDMQRAIHLPPVRYCIRGALCNATRRA